MPVCKVSYYVMDWIVLTSFIDITQHQILWKSIQRGTNRRGEIKGGILRTCRCERAETDPAERMYN